MSKLSWFKHYNTASQGHTLSVLWSNGDAEAIALFWLLHELISRFETENERGKITISWDVLARETNWKPSKCRRVLARISPVSKIEMEEKPGGYVSFLSPNWLKLQETRGGKRLAKKVQSLGEVRSKKGEGRCREDQTSDVNKELSTKSNSTQSFENKFLFNEWIDWLRRKNLRDQRIESNIQLLVNRFEEITNLENFVVETQSSKVIQDLWKNSNGSDEAVLKNKTRRYVKGAIVNEIGLGKNS